MIKKNYQLNRTKIVDETQQCLALLQIKPKFKFAVQ